MGHPAPFNMKMIGIGNENWQQPYIERYAKFHAVLKTQHPKIQLISSAGPGPADEHFKYAWPKLRELKADIVDEHSYAKPEWFFNNTHRFDNYDPKGPKVFFGEYAAQSDKIVSVLNRNNLECAVSEAAFMTGMERNAEIVRMASYAPLFAHVDGWQWTPNMIWMDNLSSYGTPNYYVQQLFALNRGDVVLPVKLDVMDGKKLYASASRDEGRGDVIVKLVNGENRSAEVTSNLSGNARLIVLSGRRADENTFTEPKKVSPKESNLKLTAGKAVTVPANSLTGLRVAIGK
jgi:alpha-N-arabinofuranosidase